MNKDNFLGTGLTIKTARLIIGSLIGGAGLVSILILSLLPIIQYLGITRWIISIVLGLILMATGFAVTLGTQQINDAVNILSRISTHIYCDNCGAKLRRTVKYCSDCGKKV